MKKAVYTTVSEISGKITELRENSILRGESIGFNILDDLVTVKKGYPLAIAGMPHSGKSEFMFEMIVNLTESLGWKHCICSPETGDPEDIIAKLTHKKTKKPIRKFTRKGIQSKFCQSDAENLEAKMWADKHFFIVDPDSIEDPGFRGFTIEQFLQNVLDIEKETGKVFDTVAIDPWMEIDEDLSHYGGREDKYLKYALTYCRRWCKQHNKLLILVHHTADVKPMIHNGQRYTPPPLPSEWAGGQMWYRKAFTMLLVWRPKSFLKNPETGEPYLDNQVLIFNQKAKPEGTGRLGAESLFWCWKASRYYEKGLLNNEWYAFGESRYEQSDNGTENGLPF